MKSYDKAIKFFARKRAGFGNARVGDKHTLDYIDALTYAVDFLQKEPKPTPETLEAIKTLDAVIPPPGNKMVDLAHLPISHAWKTIREQLLPPKEKAK